MLYVTEWQKKMKFKAVAQKEQAGRMLSTAIGIQVGFAMVSFSLSSCFFSHRPLCRLLYL